MKILFVFHHGGITGASLALFSSIEWLHENTDYKMSFLFRENGIMEDVVSKYGKVYIWEEEKYQPLSFSNRVKNKISKPKTKQQVLLENLENQRFDIIYFNTIICSKIINKMSSFSSTKIWHIHELELAINYYGVQHLEAVNNVSKIIANSRSTENTLLRYGFRKEMISVIYPFINCKKMDKLLNQSVDRTTFNIPDNAFVIGTSGTVMDRKGVDNFISMSVIIDELFPENNFYYIWVGAYTNKQKIMFDYDIDKSEKKDKILFIGEHSNPFPIYKLFDVFVSTSKEESFGLSAVEAGYFSKPLVCYKNTGGIEEIIFNSGNTTVGYMNTYHMAQEIIKLYHNTTARETLGKKAKVLAESFDVEIIMPQLTDFLNKSI